VEVVVEVIRLLMLLIKTVALEVEVVVKWLM
jgi:hypothetical protein